MVAEGRPAVVAPEDPGAPAHGAGGGTEDSVLTIAQATGRLISEAKVLLMDRYGMDAQDAFELLRHYSRTSDLPMRDVARQLVRHEWVPSD